MVIEVNHPSSANCNDEESNADFVTRFKTHLNVDLGRKTGE
jgi:hypothetical protein